MFAKTMNISASLPLVIHSLRPVIAKPSASSVARVCSAKASLPEPLRTGSRRRPCSSASFGSTPLDLVVAPAHHGVDDERVLDVDQHADRWIDPRQRFDREDRVEERGAGAAKALRNLDAHDAEREELVDELGEIFACSSISRTSGRISRSANS